MVSKSGFQALSSSDDLVIVEISTLANFNRPFLTDMSVAVEKYLGNCGRRWVDLEKTFSFMRLW
jgi:plasmid maintenance system antidote protein VapI